MLVHRLRFAASTFVLLFAACRNERTPADLDQGLLLSMAVLGTHEDGSPNPLPARMGILTREDGEWRYRFVEDGDSNVFHKALPYEDGVITFAGSRAVVKRWDGSGGRETLWERDFGGTFSRMRDAEVADIYGDGTQAIAVATHDQGVVSVLRPDGSGGFDVVELDAETDTVVHEIEIGDLNGDGVLEVYATPTAPNKVDGTPQPGKVTRYVPAAGEGRVDVVDLGDRHAKEILVEDVDGDGRDELYVSVEAISGGQVEIRRYDADSEPTSTRVVATLQDKLCRFLTAGDVDGDGSKEMVAATHKAGLWLLRPNDDMWKKELIDGESTGFEHASILLDLDDDGRDELYVASDDQKEVRRYMLTEEGWERETLVSFADDLGRFTWNIVPAPVSVLPPPTEPVSTENDAEPDQEPRGLVVKTDAVAPGYVLFAPILSDTTYLIDNDGQVVHRWKSDFAPAGGVYLRDNGNLVRPAREPDVPTFTGGGQGGRIQELTWDGELVWDYVLATEDRLMHHDVALLPNGNVLAITWERVSKEESLRAGRRPEKTPDSGLWPDMVLELEPVPPNGARIVWQWRLWDHMVQDTDPELDNFGDPAAHPDRFDINGDGDATGFPPEMVEQLQALGYLTKSAKPDELQSDMLHTNAIDYNAELDQIALSSHRFSEVWIIDHSTTTEEARGSSGGRWGKGGDILYRWGNPSTYGRGDASDQLTSGQHDVRWIPPGSPGAGNLMIFNNRFAGDYSSVYEIEPPTTDEGHYIVPATGPFGPSEPTVVYEDRESFHSWFISGAHRLENGNTLVCSGAKGRFFEVTSAGEIVWEYWTPFSGNVRNPDGSQPHPVSTDTYATFRATRLPSDAPPLAGRNLLPLSPQPAPVVRDP